TMTVTVTDDEAPSITCPSDIIQTADSGVCAAAVSVPQPQTGDNCGVASVTNDYNGTADASDFYPVGTTTVTWTVTDTSGNSTQCTMTITVTDDEAPSITCPSDITQTADSGVCAAQVSVPQPQTGDNCGVASVTNDYNGTADASDFYPVGTTTVTWTVTDTSGNSTQCTMTITVTDDEAPSITCPSDITQTADSGVCAAQVSVPQPQTGDNCGVASVINDYNGTSDASDTYPVGVTTVTWTVTDTSGNSTQCTMTITVTDDEDPFISCPSDITQPADSGVCAAAVSVPQPQTGDNCGVASVTNDYNGSADASDTYPVGVTTVTWTVTDTSGNSTQCTMTITVTDDEDPFIACPSDITQAADSGVCAAAVSVPQPQTGDNCGVASVTNDYNGTADASDTYPVGVTTVTWTVTDTSGNSTQCTMTITVTDDEAPSITCPSDITQTADSGVCAAQVSVPQPQTGDNCGVASVTNDYNGTSDASDTYPVGTTTVTWTVTDTSGNSTQCTMTITVTDDEDPEFTFCPTDILIVPDSNDCTPVATWNDPTAMDNCGNVTITSTHNSGDQFPVGTTTVTFTATDTSGNEVTCSFDVVVDPKPLEVDLTALEFNCGYNVSCNSAIDGSIDAYVSGGCLPYSYLWSHNQQSAPSINGLGAGTYSVTITDGNGTTISDSITLTEPDTLGISAQIFEYPGGNNVSCNGEEDGSIDLLISGGCPPYTYSWNTGDTTSSIGDLGAGTYEVTVTDDNGCEATATYEITEADELEITSDVTNVTCEDGNDGIIEVIVSGGITPYTYLWLDGDSSATKTGLGEGYYSVMVTDSVGCTVNASFFIGTDNVLTLNSGVTNATCGDSNGVASINVSGGNAPYNFAWSNNQSGSTIDSLLPGVYTVSVTDSSGCTAVRQVEVNNISDIELDAAVNNPTCPDFDNGSIDLIVSGTSGDVTYSWSTSDTTQNISGLVAGVYSVTVSDTTGCSAVYSAELTDDNNIDLNIQTNQATCDSSNGSATPIVSNGTAPYAFEWSDFSTDSILSGVSAGLYGLTVTDVNGCSVSDVVNIDNPGIPDMILSKVDLSCNDNNSGSINTMITGNGPFTFIWSNGDTTQNIARLSAGTYSVTATDVNGCEAVRHIEINQPIAITIDADYENVSCFNGSDGSIDLDISGGISPYDVIWSHGDTSTNLTGLSADTYDVTVTDANGCEAMTSVLISEPDELIVSLDSISQQSCALNDAAIFVSTEGGTLPYTYVWSNDDTLNQAYQTGLSGGTYSVFVFDANECFSDTLTFEIHELDSVSLSVVEYADITCNSDSTGFIDLEVSGGHMPYSYWWSTGDTTEDLSGLAAGNYYVVVSDSNGCYSDTLSMELTEPDSLTLEIVSVENETCESASDGVVIVNASGSNGPPYSYDWSGGMSGDSIGGLTGGIYVVTVSDTVGCSKTLEVTVETNEWADLSSTVVGNASCDTICDGFIDVVVVGVSEYTESWQAFDPENNPISVPSNFEPFDLCVGRYILTIEYGTGCFVSDTFTISAPTCNRPPFAVDDTASTFEGTPIDIPVIDNDHDPDGHGISVTGVTQPNSGYTSINSDGTINYDPDDGFVGVDTFYYTICDNGNPVLCDDAMVIVHVLPGKPNIFIPNGFSPNGDGINDTWEITDIENYPANEIEIFNRWGNSIYKEKNYRSTWEGTNQSGDPLPDGTYYYVLSLNDENKTVFTGFIQLHRANE
ncbi:MAG: HYR domain-containing protein, partial [Chitinophagales bacterium]